MSDVVLITGASTGFGRESAELLARRGYRVFATMREPAGRNAQACAELDAVPNIEVLELDVTDDRSVESAIAHALQRAERIDVVINNAGFGNIGVTESYTASEFQQVFETNLFGAVRVNRAVLPAMRRQRSGLLIHVTSILGRVTLPYMSLYSSSKYALESVAEAYRMELAPFGVDSVVVEPGVFNTPIFGKNFTPADRSRGDDYGADNYHRRIGDAFAEMLSDPNAPPVTDVAETFLRLIETPAGERPFRTYVGGGDNFLALYNEAADQLRAGIAEVFGVANLLTLRQTRAAGEA